MKLLILFLSIAKVINGAFEIPEPLNGGIEGNPGLQTCMRPRILPSFAGFFGRIIESEFPKLTPPDVTVKLPSVNQGAVVFRKLRFLSFSNASEHSFRFLPPNETEWTSSDLNYNISGQFNSALQQRFSSTQTSGSILLSAKNATLVVRAGIRAAQNGREQLEVASCKVNFGNASAVTQSSGFFGGLFKWFHSILSSNAAAMLERVTCDAVRYYVDNVLNVVLDSLPTSAIASEDLPPELMLHYGLLRDARVYKNCLSMQESGDVSWGNKSGAPFYPLRLNYSARLAGDHMMDVWISDYVFNSLLFHANDHGVFDVTLNEDRAPLFIPHLQSQCAVKASAENCVGLALPEVSNADEFPKQVAELRLKPSEGAFAPYVVFRDDGSVLLVMDLVLDLFLNDTRGKRRNVVTAEARIESTLRNVSVNGSLLSAEASKTTVPLIISQDQLFSPTLKGIDTATFGIFIGNLVEKLINNRLVNGVSLPQFKGWKFVKEEPIIFLNRTVNIATDLEFDQEFWANATSDARLRLHARK